MHSFQHRKENLKLEYGLERTRSCWKLEKFKIVPFSNTKHKF